MRYVKRESIKDFAKKMVERYQIIERIRKQDEQNRKERTPPTMPQNPA
jgi:hypothetical protein